MVWGRQHTRRVSEILSAIWETDPFVMGHQTAEVGFKVQGETMMILASNHDHGMILPIDLTKRYAIVDLVDQLVPLAAVIPSHA